MDNKNTRINENIRNSETNTGGGDLPFHFPPVDEQLRIIAKGAWEIVSEPELRDKLVRSQKEKRPLIIKLGLDPSAPDIHLGHAVVLRKIRQMQDLGHRAVIVIGDMTGKIGDPTGKSKGRVALSDEVVKANALTYQQQIFKILDPSRTEVRFNSEWLAKMNLEEVLNLAATTTVARMLEREEFRKRYESNTPIGIHEFFYPLMQARDSVELHADIELGGTDQTFNILMGRTLQRTLGQEPQIAIFMPILEGLDGVEKMSKSLGNYIGVEEDAKTMFKKVMEIPDVLILRYFELATDEHPDKVEALRRRLDQGENPRDVKLELAAVITSLYHSKEEATAAAEYYHTVFSKRELPEDMEELTIVSDKDRLIDVIPVLVQRGFAASNSEFRRLFLQGGVQINKEKCQDLEVVLASGDVLKIGKKKFVRIVK